MALAVRISAETLLPRTCFALPDRCPWANDAPHGTAGAKADPNATITLTRPARPRMPKAAVSARDDSVVRYKDLSWLPHSFGSFMILIIISTTYPSLDLFPKIFRPKACSTRHVAANRCRNLISVGASNDENGTQFLRAVPTNDRKRIKQERKNR